MIEGEGQLVVENFPVNKRSKNSSNWMPWESVGQTEWDLNVKMNKADGPEREEGYFCQGPNPSVSHF